MTDNRNCNQVSNAAETVCIDTYQVLDSCRDRDCFENTRIYLGAEAQALINSCATVRVRSAEIACGNVTVNSVAFNDGFYQVNARFYLRIVVEICVGQGRVQEYCGLSVVDKSVVLYGGNGNVNIFRSNPENNGPCPTCDPDLASNNLPIGVVETVTPIVLSTKVACAPCECYDPCRFSDIPESVMELLNCDVTDTAESDYVLLATFGLFSVVRIERPAQFLVSATDYSVPDKECPCDRAEDPCSLFRTIKFPTEEFNGTATSSNNRRNNEGNNSGGCGCRKN